MKPWTQSLSEVAIAGILVSGGCCCMYLVVTHAWVMLQFFAGLVALAFVSALGFAGFVWLTGKIE